MSPSLCSQPKQQLIWQTTADDTELLVSLAQMREQAGDHVGAEQMYRLVNFDQNDALARLALRREQTGSHGGTGQLTVCAAEAADAGR